MRDDIDLRAHIGSDVLDQGHRPTCVAFASSAAHEALQDADEGLPGSGDAVVAHLAPEALWWQATAAGHTSGYGMVLQHAGPALSGLGQPALSAWPYDVTLGAGTQDPPAGLADPPWRRAQLGNLPLMHDGMEDPLEDALARSRPVILIIEVTDNFHLPNEEGVVTVPNVRATAGGYHAVICVGAANHPVYGRLLLIKNSWGTGWGLSGYGWLPVEYLTGFAGQAAVIDDVPEN